jgi:predicted amidohydrolase
MYVCGTFYEKREDLVYNTAALFDREGKLVGTYEKRQVWEPELDAGCTPGVRSPVFETDFGKVGAIICYDGWFPQTTQLLSLKGAELVLIANVGSGSPAARALDNGVWIAGASQTGSGGIWDSRGVQAGHGGGGSISGYEKDDANNIIVATVDLSRRRGPDQWNGPMLSAPYGRRVRQTGIERLEDEIAREAKRWWDE